jgi:uncharacterized RDD family membrane protein YckC
MMTPDNLMHSTLEWSECLMGNQFVQSCDVASKGLRFANFILDAIFINILSFVVWFMIGFSVGIFSVATGTAHTVVPAFQALLLSLPVRLLITCFNVFVYFVLCEALGQRTLAKLITGTKVVTVNGTKPTFGAIGLRTLCRLIPFEPFSFLTGHPGGWHDWWSGTIVVQAHAAQYRQPQPANDPVAGVDLPVRSAGIPLCEPAPQGAATPEPACVPLAVSMLRDPMPTCTPVAAGGAPRAQGTHRNWMTVWIVAGAIVFVLGAIMMWSANRPVKPASASDTFDWTKPINTPPSAPVVHAPSSAPSIPIPVPLPEPTSVSPALPASIEIDAVVTADGKILVYSDLGVLREGQTVSGCKVVRITDREIVLKRGDAVKTYPLSAPNTGPN